MFDAKYLESGEFYQRRYKNFSTLIIMPLFILLIVVVLFGLIATREITTKATGQIIPAKVLSVIQSTSNNAIDENLLSENKLIKKGDVLMSFKHDDEQLSTQVLTQQINNVNDRLQSLATYKTSINAGSSQFSGQDKFGYDSLFNDYIAQTSALNDDFSQQISDKETANQQAEHQVDVLKKNKAKNSDKLQQYQALLNAISHDSDIKNNMYQSIYDSYVSQRQSATTSTERAEVKQVAINNIQQQIDQFSNGNDTYDVQIAGIGKSGPLSKSSTLDKVADLKNQQLASVQKEINTDQQNLDELKAKQQSANNNYKDTVIKSPEAGVLHLGTDKSKAKYYPKGTTIAQLYPELTAKTKLEIEYYVPTSHIIGLTVNQKIRFVANQNVTQPMVLDGMVKEIDTAATETKEGAFYRCVAKLTVSRSQRENIKYGISGRVTIIKGKKTWAAYYMGKMMGDRND
ncbi:bacteriocin secretion accessory protein [Leuconostoc carnosum]|uniref:bacteriocin secretion accessory protein n=1 Tax=Leuconostoc carnosum TaxID=1252 RepID=UPI000D51A913|nr:bacteriocin secretion accessory protein [Leuconostoc carnosum]KAA8324540.1 bacteriocin secretion accessory protein [Leuconostoc carnosum]KAA8358213.1 bacteriocin secretion accessory protein [Leuconostoc carnosum]KAA8364711.1 bacteriocin secretion accessory protein [Leuconostoc carnosum]KAA8365584.1 bacteriocin secretion accessory protein [Leuconostoc carnosum]KAA8371612.1 bacteriocin secretion accessory protein [Leuconostoc carnosum]